MSLPQNDDHLPISWDDYFVIHEVTMGHFYDRRMICDDNLRIKRTGDIFRMVGAIGLPGEIVIRVEKNIKCLDRRTDPTVQTISYAYNASVFGHNVIFRYDNLHAHKGHGDAHHVHRHDWKSGREDGNSPEWIGEGRWPKLNHVIEEAYHWYCDHRSELPNPDRCPDLTLVRDE